MEQGKDSSTLVLYVIGALLLVVGAAWLLLGLRGSPSSAPIPTQVVAPPTAAPVDAGFDLQQSLDMGEMALRAGQLVEPTNGSALYFFLNALNQDPDNAAARDGLARIQSSMAARARAQLAAERFGDLDASMRVMQRIDAAAPALLALRARRDEVVAARFAAVGQAIERGQLPSAQTLLDQLATIPGVDAQLLAVRRQELATALEEAANAPPVAPVAVAAEVDAPGQADAPLPAESQAADSITPPPTEVADSPEAGAAGDGASDFGAQLAAQAAQRVTAGQLLLPADDSAAFYLRELQVAAPDDPALVEGIEDLIGALEQRALASAQSGAYDEAQRLLDEARSFGVGEQRIAATETRIETMRIDAQGQRLIPAGEMVNTRVVRPRYPIRALRSGTEGYVLLNFTVLTDGTTDQIEVVETSDKYADQFVRAAEDAVAQWEFEPREFLGQAIEQRVQARVTFDMDL